MNILGLNAFHADSSAALLINGEIIAAGEEERFSRQKHTGSFPWQAISFCLLQGGLSLDDIDYVAIAYNPRSNIIPKLRYSFSHKVSPIEIIKRIRAKAGKQTLRQLIDSTPNSGELPAAATINFVEHHLSHLATAYYLSPFENCALLSIDGMGDFASCMLGYGKDNRIRANYGTHFPNSLGYLYTAITMLLGFTHFGDEYKIMGLAPYGTPRYIQEFREIVRLEGSRIVLNPQYFKISLSSLCKIDDKGVPHVQACHTPAMEELLGFSPELLEDSTGYMADVAASLQQRTEEIIMGLLAALHQRYPDQRLGIAGGVAMNSVAIGKISHCTPFKEVFVPPGAADNGASIGAGLYTYFSLRPEARRIPLDHAYLGPRYSDNEVRTALEKSGLTFRHFENEEALLEETVTELCNGKVIAWFQGRMEFGARALGGRSILADPRDASMKERINSKIKNREPFRPFAPSILEEHASQYFVENESSLFMERVLTVRPEKRDLIPAVVHVDGSGRLQTVRKSTNPRYWNLIDTFYRRTDIPVLLNTSFNQQEPVVCTPSEAIDCFLRSGLELLVIENFIVLK